MRNLLIEEPRLLDPAQCVGMKFVINYQTTGYYDIAIDRTERSTSFCLSMKSFPSPVTKSFEIELCPAYFEQPADYIYADGDRMVALLEYSHEQWHNRLRITELWVHEDYRRQGLGGKLLEFAKEKAKLKGCREVVLESQSCNLPAISLYLRHGFRFVGLDTTCYTNQDVDRQEVRIEMGFPIEGA